MEIRQFLIFLSKIFLQEEHLLRNQNSFLMVKPSFLAVPKEEFSELT
jgi:hypothetical protein